MISGSNHLLESSPAFDQLMMIVGVLYLQRARTPSINIFKTHCKICCLSNASFSENIQACDLVSSIQVYVRGLWICPCPSPLLRFLSLIGKNFVCTWVQKCAIFMVNGSKGLHIESSKRSVL